MILRADAFFIRLMYILVSEKNKLNDIKTFPVFPFYTSWKHQKILPDPAGIYLLKVKNRNSGTRCEICLKLTIKTPERRVSHLVLVFLLLTLNVITYKLTIWQSNPAINSCLDMSHHPGKKLLTYSIRLNKWPLVNFRGSKMKL